ncbi:MAG: hypothetical protein WD872_18800 [Pirellulaceae bacterium]
MPRETPSSPSLIEPALLIAFRQQAGGILSQERGLTGAGRAKLAEIARQLGIGEEQLEVAIRSLGESEAPPAPENPRIEKFRRRLQKDLAASGRAILGPRIETQIVAVAAEKYGLDEPAARQVLARVASELGLRQISTDQAIDSLAAQIDQAAGEATWLAKEAWDRLRIAGAKWGVELEVIDELIDEKLAANRALRDRWRFRTRATLALAGGALAIVGLLLAFLVLRDRSAQIAASPDTPAAGEAEAAPKLAQPALPPDWWDVDLSLAVANLRRFDDAKPAYEFLIADSPSDRTIAYRKLADLADAASSSDGLRTAIAATLAGCYALEPDDTAASELLAAVLELVPAAAAPLAKSKAEYQTAYWAGETLVRMAHRPAIPAARYQSLAGEIERNLSFSLSQPAVRRGDDEAAHAAITRRLFAQLAAAAPVQPAEVAARYKNLAGLAADLSDEAFTRLEATFLAAALPTAKDQWPAYQAGVVRVVSSPDPLQVLKMLDAYERTVDPAIKQRLAELLVARSGAAVTSWDPAAVIPAVRLGLGVAESAATRAYDRWRMLKLQADAALARRAPATDDHDAWLAQVVELAHLTTLAIALAQGDAGEAVFDAGIGNPPQLGGPMTDDSPGERDSAMPHRTGGALLPREQREVNHWTNMVGSFERQEPIKRQSNFRGLGMFADKLTDLTPQQAVRVARYVLAEKSPEEHDVVVQGLAGMRQWKRLRLAIADELPQSKLSPEQFAVVIRTFLPGVGPEDMTNPDTLRHALVQGVLADLEDSAGGEGESAELVAPSESFDQAAELLTETYRARAKLFGAPATAAAEADSPAAALHLSLQRIADALRTTAEPEDLTRLARLPHEAIAWGHVARDDLHRAVAIQRTYCELSARRLARLRPGQARAAAEIWAQRDAAKFAATTVLAQLREQEAASLQLGMLHAPPL